MSLLDISTQHLIVFIDIASNTYPIIIRISSTNLIIRIILLHQPIDPLLA